MNARTPVPLANRLPAVSASPRPRIAARGEAPPLILVHTMPWYQARPFSPGWGWHWTMNAFDPGTQSAGLPQIASHYHPLIGPYDSGDPDVIEYHILLSRLAGIDGIVIDWYGRTDYHDFALIYRNSSALVEQAARAHLRFAVCYEDQTIPQLVAAGRLTPNARVAHARDEIAWMRDHWFRDPAYVTLNGRPVLLSFGLDGLSDDEWAQALNGMPGAPLYLSEHARRSAAAGAFDWPVPQVGLKAQDAFYEEARGWPAGMAVAFPRFHDIYEQARVQKSWGTIPDDAGTTFTRTLERALRSGLPFVQISTWNDWGEGTQIEPSVEFGYRDLVTIQRLRRRWVEPGFRVTPDDLRLPLRLFRLRKARRGRHPVDRGLDRIAQLLANRSARAAREALDRIAGLRPGVLRLRSGAMPTRARAIVRREVPSAGQAL